MKKVLFVLTVLFSIVCFAGAGYVLCTGGQASPGYAVIPMIFSIACSQGYITLREKDKE